MELGGGVFETIRLNYNVVSSAEKRVADYILKNPERTVMANVSELAEQSGTSDATVIRLCKHVGYKGFYHMKLQLAHDLGREQLFSGAIVPKDPDNWKDVLKEIATNIVRAASSIDDDVLRRCVDLILNCDTVHLAAVGNSIPASIDFAFRLGRIGVRTISSFMPEQQLNGINMGTERDIVIGISHSGSSKQLLQAFELAKKKNMRTVAITDLKRTPVETEADHILSTGIEYSSVYNFGAASHIYISSLLDIILHIVANAKGAAESKGETDKIEEFLSETKV